jgi:hypothetical protein
MHHYMSIFAIAAWKKANLQRIAEGVEHRKAIMMIHSGI